MTEVKNHRKVSGKTYYLLSWKLEGAADSWQPAENCEGCKQLINEYRARKNLKFLDITVGASSEPNANYDERNWQTVKSILKDIETYSNKEYSKEIEVLNYEDKLSNNVKIYLFTLGSHAFVGLWLASDKRI